MGPRGGGRFEVDQILSHQLVLSAGLDGCRWAHSRSSSGPIADEWRADGCFAAPRRMTKQNDTSEGQSARISQSGTLALRNAETGRSSARTPLALTAAFAAAMLLSACGGSDDQSTAGGESAATTSAAVETPAPASETASAPAASAGEAAPAADETPAAEPAAPAAVPEPASTPAAEPAPAESAPASPGSAATPPKLLLKKRRPPRGRPRPPKQRPPPRHRHLRRAVQRLPPLRPRRQTTRCPCSIPNHRYRRKWRP